MPISVKRKLAASHHKGATVWFWFTAGASSSRILYNTTTLAEFALNYLLSLYKLFSRDWRLSLRTLFKKNLTRTHTDPNTKVVYYTWRRSNRTHSNPNTRVEYYTWSRSNRTPPTQTPGQNIIPGVGAAIGPSPTQTLGQNIIPGVGGAQDPHQPKHQGRIFYLQKEQYEDPHKPKYQGHQGRMFKTQSKTF